MNETMPNNASEHNSGQHSGWIGMRFDPLDTLFFRDGRPFDAANRVEAGLPNPQTLAGAVRTALLGKTGFSFTGFQSKVKDRTMIREALQASGAPPWILGARFRGPWFALATDDQHLEPLLPQPLTLVKKKNENTFLCSRPLEPGDLPGWRDDDGLLPLWRKGKPDAKAPRGYIMLSEMKKLLRNEPLSPEQVVPATDIYGHDNRVGIGMNMETLTSEEGQIYGIRMLALAPKRPGNRDCENPNKNAARVCLYAEILPGADPNSPRELPLPSLIPLGGEGRYVRATTTAPCDWPTADPSRDRAWWYLATPSWYDAGKRLPRIDGAKIRAAVSSAPLGVSGWDIALNGPRPTRYVIPAGAVYFVEGGKAPPNESLCSDADMAQEGWGFALQGAW